MLGIILAEPIATSAKFWGFTKVRGTLVTIRMDYNLRTIYIQFRMTQRRTCNMIILTEIKNETNLRKKWHNHALKKLIKAILFVFGNTLNSCVNDNSCKKVLFTTGFLGFLWHLQTRNAHFFTQKWRFEPHKCDWKAMLTRIVCWMFSKGSCGFFNNPKKQQKKHTKFPNFCLIQH